MEERLRGGMVGVENVEEWSKRRNGWRGNVEERLRGGMVGAENVEEWFGEERGGWFGGGTWRKG